MADFRIDGGNFFEQGLTGVSELGTMDSAKLPDSHELTPAELAQRPQLDELLAMPNMDSFVEKMLRPVLSNPNLLAPSTFAKTQTTMISTIENEANMIRNSDPEGAKILDRAARLLADDASMRALVRHYCSALFQG